MIKKIIYSLAILLLISYILPIKSVMAVPDTAPPSVPQNLIATGNTDSTVSISWNFSIDNFPDPISYNIYSNGGQVGSSTSTTFTAINLQPSTQYSFTVKALDAAGNISDASSPLLVDTIADKIPPVVQITFPVNNSAVDGLTTFTASSSDDVLLTGVRFQLDGSDFTDILTSKPFTVTFNPNNYPQHSSHTLVALGYDPSGNIGRSPAVNFSVGKLMASQPFSIQATNITGNSAIITWQTYYGVTGSINYGLTTSYGQQATESSPSTLHSLQLSGLQSSQTYHFYVSSNKPGYATATSTDLSFDTTDYIPATSTQLSVAVGPHPDGTLIIDGNTIYLISEGHRVAFRDSAEYRSYGYNFSQAVTATDKDLNLPQTSVAKAMEGTLVLDKSDGKTVYMIGTNGTKRGFASAQAFTGLGYTFKNLALVDLKDYPAGPAISTNSETHPDGALVLENKTVWWIRNGQRQAFESAAVFNTYGFDFQKIVPANTADLALPVGSAVKFRDGTLVNESGIYYIISNGKKKKFASAETLSSNGYKLSNAITADIASYSSDSDVSAY